MPHFSNLPSPRRYNTMRLLGYDYKSVFKLCAISIPTELRRPLFADIKLAKSVLASLLSEQTLSLMRVRAFTLMPDHLHLIAGIRQTEVDLPSLLGRFESYTTQLYWKRSREIVDSNEIRLPPTSVEKSESKSIQEIMAAVTDWRATLRPEVVEVKNWPNVKPEMFLKKRLWQKRPFDHVIRNDQDLQENLDYIAMNSVKAGYVTRPEFYPFTGFLRWED